MHCKKGEFINTKVVITACNIKNSEWSEFLMPVSVKYGNNERMSFARQRDILQMPNLIELQKDSYKWFLEEGLSDVLRDVSPITDHTGNLVMDFMEFTLEDTPKYSVEECKERDATYAAPIKVKVRLINKETGEVKEQEIFMGDFPIMTENGTFIINGAERVVVSQVVRSPGIYYGMSMDKTGKKLYNCTIIPNRGAWLEYETDANDVFSARIDKNRKIPVTALLRAIGLKTDSNIIAVYGENDLIKATIDKDPCHTEEESLLEIYRKMRPGEPPTVDSARAMIDNLFFDDRRYDLSKVGRYKYNKKLAISVRIANQVLAEPAVDPMTGEIIFEEGKRLSREDANLLENKGVNHVVISIDGKKLTVFSNGMVDLAGFVKFNPAEIGVTEKVRFTVLKEILEKKLSKNELIDEIKRRLYDYWETDEEGKEVKMPGLIPKHIIEDDIYASVNYLNCLACGIVTIDDIDHLGNRRLRSVGELLQNQFRIGFARMERTIKERMTIQDLDIVTPQALINIRPVVASIKEFFGSSPLSQFMDQTNPLAELTHKRRLSALGPGGLSRERAGFEVRDVHHSHYGRMCPIETPEGPNIGLISYLSTYARVNEFGFIEAPYRKIDKKTGKVLDEVVYLTADAEDGFVIAQANEPIDKNGMLKNARITARSRDNIIEVNREDIDFLDVSPQMMVSVATAMIPFLENDDANRALMGSNMQRQAVPLLKTEAPIVGTGMEYKVAVDSGVCVIAKKSGIVKKVSAKEIIVVNDEGDEDRYHITKFLRSNQGTCINQRPIVNHGQRVSAGEVIADGPSTQNGELSLGRNVVVGFMTWEGYNYEDAILINEKLVRDDVYTSIHIEEYETEARDTKLGAEEITREITNVGEDALKDLDESGIIRIGAEVHAGDILVGKVTPKGETELTPEERLLRAIFGEKAREVRDTSLRVPHGESGIVVDVKVFTRENGDELSPGVNKAVRVSIAQKRKISVGDKMAGRHGNKGVISRILPQEDMPFLPDGTPLDIVLNPLGVPSRMNIGQVLEVHLGYAAKLLGWKIATPVFDGANEEDIMETFDKAGISRTGKSVLYDGRTGEPFDNPITVGYMYFLKLAHLVDDKIHARSTGPYSLVTQQPLGGKAQFGGQRFGEMEVWALEAYGAAYTLQEILTVKSDDIMGRVKTYEAIVKGQNIPQSGIPESFKVLIKELQSLSLDMRVLDANNDEIELKESFEDDIGIPASIVESDIVVEEDVSEEFEDSGYSVTDEDSQSDDLLDDIVLDDAEPEDIFDDFKI